MARRLLPVPLKIAAELVSPPLAGGDEKQQAGSQTGIIELRFAEWSATAPLPTSIYPLLPDYPRGSLLGRLGSASALYGTSDDSNCE